MENSELPLIPDVFPTKFYYRSSIVSLFLFIRNEIFIKNLSEKLVRGHVYLTESDTSIFMKRLGI